MVSFRRHPVLFSVAAGAVWTVLVAWLDVQTGLQLRLGPFFLLPVLLIAWYGGMVPGVLGALVAAGAWRGVEVIWQSGPLPGWVLFWDAFIHLVSFGAVAVFVAWGRTLMLRERALVLDLSTLIANVKELEGLLPVCAWCKKVRDDQGYWQQIETYVKTHSKADCTHGICPECAQQMMKGEDEFKLSDAPGESLPKN